nr:MAG TPA: hypothetical protein [Caudoviricetes sp.]
MNYFLQVFLKGGLIIMKKSLFCLIELSVCWLKFRF